MPIKQIRKNSKSKRSNRKSQSSRQRGGDPGRVALPMAYFSKNGTPGYFANGSSELESCPRQVAVSQGVIHSNGKWAGPNLYPMLGGKRSKRSKRSSQRGGSCGCSGRRAKTSRKSMTKSRKSKTSRKH